MLAASAPTFFLNEEGLFAAVFTQPRVRDFVQLGFGDRRIINSVGQIQWWSSDL